MTASVTPDKSQPDSEPPTAESAAAHAHRDRHGDGPASRRRASRQGHGPSSTTTIPSAHSWSQLFSLASVRMSESETIRGGGRAESHSPRANTCSKSEPHPGRSRDSGFKAKSSIPTTVARHKGCPDSHPDTHPPPLPQCPTRQRVLVLLPPTAAMDRLNLTEITHSASQALGHRLQFSDIVLSVAHSPLALTDSPPPVRTSNAAVQTPASFFLSTNGASNASHLPTSSSQQPPQPTTTTGHGVPILTTRPKGHGPGSHHLIIRNLHPHTTCADLLSLLPSPLPASLAAVFYPPHDKHRHPGRASICFFTAKDGALLALDHVTRKIETGLADTYALRAADVAGFECDGDSDGSPPGVTARYSEHVHVPEKRGPRRHTRTRYGGRTEDRGAGDARQPPHVSPLAKRCTRSWNREKIASAADAARAEKFGMCQGAADVLEWREKEWVWRPHLAAKAEQATGLADGGASRRDAGKWEQPVSDWDELNMTSRTVPAPSGKVTSSDSDQDMLVSSDSDSIGSSGEDNVQSGDDVQPGSDLPEDMLWQYFEQVHLKQIQHQQVNASGPPAPASPSAPGSAASGESTVMISPLAEPGGEVPTSGGSWSSSWSPLPGSSEEDEQSLGGGSEAQTGQDPWEVHVARGRGGSSRRSVAAAQ